MMKKASFAELVSEVDKLLNGKNRVVVAISGYGGAGKTTLANAVYKNFKPNATMLSLDDFVINHGKGSGWSGGFDWPRFEAVLKDIQAGKDLHYQTYDWAKDSLREDYVDVKLSKLIVVDGVRIFQPELMPYFDYTIWVNVDLKTATTRGKLRDEQKWQDKTNQDALQAHLEDWDKVWVPKENRI